MWHEPNCSIDLDVYKDWLYEFNNNDELREIDFANLVTSVDRPFIAHGVNTGDFGGLGNGFNHEDGSEIIPCHIEMRDANRGSGDVHRLTGFYSENSIWIDTTMVYGDDENNCLSVQFLGCGC